MVTGVGGGVVRRGVGVLGGVGVWVCGVVVGGGGEGGWALYTAVTHGLRIPPDMIYTD